MKVSGNGQAKILTAIELEQLFSDGLINSRDRCLFAICLFFAALSRSIARAEEAGCFGYWLVV